MERFTSKDLELLEATRRLRRDVYLERGFLTSADLRDGIDADEHDSHSLHVAVMLATGEVVGTVRLIHPCEKPLPIECPPFTIDDEWRGLSAVEASRLAVSSKFRGTHVSQILWREVYWGAVDAGAESIFAVQEDVLLRLLTRIGYPFSAIGPRAFAYGTPNFPTACPVAEVLPALAARNPGMSAFFAGSSRPAIIDAADVPPDSNDVASFL